MFVMLSVSFSYITNKLLTLICRSHCIGDLFVLLKAPPMRAAPMRFHQCSWNACPTSLPNYLFQNTVCSATHRHLQLPRQSSWQSSFFFQLRDHGYDTRLYFLPCSLIMNDRKITRNLSIMPINQLNSYSIFLIFGTELHLAALYTLSAFRSCRLR